ncbi:hypothetical protein FHS83_003053 [Rhizomicrobium palustre]|uniref:Gylcosyl hydrolase 115 C-terminal domain-containing protein n=1 Tax=Rhizomicrobium palustre TaxID=189966 RepID=A0A846N2M2_9PROT|nr:glycosyl hydrolase 115 family protein [Rhizomicrobium palustre]NIK89735.1 hypothetical protein [Rhizomicrobium palustre]
MRISALITVLMAVSGAAYACDTPVSVCPKQSTGALALIAGGTPARVIVDAKADNAVRHVAESFAEDLERVSGKKAELSNAPGKGPMVIIGVLGQSKILDDLIKRGKLKAEDIKGQWEAYRQIVVEKPYKGVAEALVIVGADRRGAVFGTYDISEKMGVSPAYWFADVPVRHADNLFITAGSREDQPKVRYRGFFINDEAPAFSTWTKEKFGGANHKAYAHIFEYLLRMKGNYLWPAMWAPRAFNADDRENMVLADAMGVVMGTSHHEPMTRAQDEWHRDTDKGVTGGKWDYTSNGENLRKFWRGGIERMMSKGDGTPYESLVTVGMRGDGDEPMAEGTATKLLETIVADQRKIIADVTKKPADQTPQVWALYKEVQDYYDHGMSVPDDVILLFADDNWGQLRRLATRDLNHKGGFGIYYHFDYVGGPRNYKWINTNQIEKTWQQMDLAYRSNARSLWVVNVGDIKPMEFPLQFFLKQAWNPEAMTPAALKAYPAEWAKATFGAENAAIGDLVTRYSQFAARKKPELIDPATFSLSDYEIFATQWQMLVADMWAEKKKLPPEALDAYFELVEHPILALSNLYDLYYNVALNRMFAAKNNPVANLFADKAEAAFKRDKELSAQYHALKGGKWDGMMLQTHIGYTYWNEPKTDIMPEVRRVPGEAPKRAIVIPATAVPPDVISREAPDFTRAVNGKGLTWTPIAHLGRTKGAVLALPQGEGATTPADNVRLEYDVTLTKAGEATLKLYMAPTIDAKGAGGITIGVSLDDGPVETLRYNLLATPGAAANPDQAAWIEAVSNNIHVLSAKFPRVTAGKHTLKIWRLSDNAVLEKLVLSTGPVPERYLGP